MRAHAALAATAAALALGACGGADAQSDEDQIRSAVRDYAAAVAGHDPGQACDVIVTAAQLAGSEEARDRDRDRCRDRVGRGRLSVGPALGGVEVESVAVSGSRAVARVRARGARERIALRHVDGRWRIIAPA